MCVILPLTLNFRQLGYRNSTKLVPLVQGLAQQIHLFLAEYNRYNSDSSSYLRHQTNSNSHDNEYYVDESGKNHQIHLPGFRRRRKTKRLVKHHLRVKLTGELY